MEKLSPASRLLLRQYESEVKEKLQADHAEPLEKILKESKQNVNNLINNNL